MLSGALYVCMRFVLHVLLLFRLWQELGMPDYISAVGEPIDLMTIGRYGTSVCVHDMWRSCLPLLAVFICF